jgi:hypothetical protein
MPPVSLAGPRRPSLPSRALPLAFLVLLPASALAQGATAPPGAPDLTGTGGGPGTTITAPYTNRLGVTKPPGGVDRSNAARPNRAERRERRLDDRIDDSVCDGCE